jgi:hypothetical protein
MVLWTQPTSKPTSTVMERLSDGFQRFQKNHLRFISPHTAVLWVPAFLLPSRYKAVPCDTLAKAMVQDAEAFLGNINNFKADDMSMGRRNIRRLYYEDFAQLAANETKPPSL